MDETGAPAGTTRTNLVRAGAAVLLVVGGALTVRGLLLGLHFESTPRALEDAAKGEVVGYPAALGVLLALAALAGSRRRWAVVAVALSAVACGVAVAMELSR